MTILIRNFCGFFLGFLLLSHSLEAQSLSVARVSGQLLERGTKKPMAGVNIFVLPAKLKAITDDQGRFAIESVPYGAIQFVVNAPGYLKLEKSDELSRPEVSRQLFLERASYQGLEATVVGKIAKRDDSTRTLKTEQFLTMPGSGGDPVKAVQNLPGVARASAVSSQVIIQGSSPQDTLYLIEDNEVPLVFHFGGLTSVVTPEAVENVDYLSAGYGPEYGRAMGGIVGLKLKNPAEDRQKGFVFMDTTKAGALIEGPLDSRSSYLVTGRYSYLGYVLQAVLKDNAQFDLTVAPAFADLTAIYRRKVNERDDFRLVTIGSRDELKFLFKEPVREDPGLRGKFSSETLFYRVIPQWVHKYDSDRAAKMSVGFGQDLIRIDVGDDFFDLKSTVVSPRAEYETKLSPLWKAHFGLDSAITRAKVDLRLPAIANGGGVSNPISTGQPIEVSIERDDFVVGPYWRNTLKNEGSSWTFMPSLRTDYFSITRELKPQPRLALRYDADETLFYRAAAGLYYQPPEPQETASNYGNPDIKAPFAWHYTVGIDKDFKGGSSRGWNANGSLFYRNFENLVVSSTRLVTRAGETVFERYANDGRGRAYGAEFQLRYDAKPWTGWIVYTVSRSYRSEPGQGEFLFRYDQTHNVNLNGSVELGSNWKLAARVRFVTGNPLTPIIGGSFDADNDVYVPRRGPFYSERDDPFFQVDVRADKKWVYDTWILWGYLDVQNITNRQNSEGLRYSYDYSQKKAVNGLPALPTIGVRGEF